MSIDQHMINLPISPEEKRIFDGMQKVIGDLETERIRHSFQFRRLRYAVSEEDKKKYLYYKLVTVLQHWYFEAVEKEIEEDIRLHGLGPYDEILQTSMPEEFLRRHLGKNYK